MRDFLNALRWTAAILGVLLTGLLCAFFGLMDRSRRIPLFFNRLFAKVFLPMTGIDLHVTGLERCVRGKNYIVCSNHQGLFDIFSLMAVLPFPLRFVSKPSYFKIPFVGWGMRGSGHIEITRTDKIKDRETLDQMVPLAKAGVTFVMFPEGTRTRDGTIGPFKYGAFYLAIQSGRPILPITIRGSFERMRKGKLLPIPGLIQLSIHPAIDPSGHTVESLTEKTRAVIASIF